MDIFCHFLIFFYRQYGQYSSFVGSTCPIVGQHFYFYHYIVLCQDKENSIMARIIEQNEKNLVGPMVRKTRLEKHMSQQELSAKLETMAIYICRGSISRIEDQSRTVTDIELYGLSKILNIPLENFFIGIE